MIPNEAVEAAARALAPHLFPQTGLDLSAAQQQTGFKDRVRAALEAALPHLLGGPVAWIVYAENGNTRLWTLKDGAERAQRLATEWGTVAHPLYAPPHIIASQGCGTGHSADAGSLPALAVTDVRENWELTDEFGWATPTEVEQAIAILSQNNGDLAYKIQGCFARGGAFAEPVEGDGNLAACAREAGWALTENVDRLPWERRGRIAAIVQKLGAALMVHDDDGGEAVHARPLTAARAEPQNDLYAHPTKGGEA